jgi:hypothetical protein
VAVTSNATADPSRSRRRTDLLPDRASSSVLYRRC